VGGFVTSKAWVLDWGGYLHIALVKDHLCLIGVLSCLVLVTHDVCVWEASVGLCDVGVGEVMCMFEG